MWPVDDERNADWDKKSWLRAKTGVCSSQEETERRKYFVWTCAVCNVHLCNAQGAGCKVQGALLIAILCDPLLGDFSKALNCFHPS